MQAQRVGVIGPDDLIDDIVADREFQATKSAYKKREGGGAAADPFTDTFTTSVAVATVVIAADKLLQAAKLVGGAVVKWFGKKKQSEKKEFVECQLIIRRENGEEHLLQFSSRMTEEEIANQVKEFLE